MYDIISKAEVAKIVTLFLGVCVSPQPSPFLSSLFYCFIAGVGVTHKKVGMRFQCFTPTLPLSLHISPLLGCWPVLDLFSNTHHPSHHTTTAKHPLSFLHLFSHNTPKHTKTHIRKMGSGASQPEKDEIVKGITGKERPVDAVDSVDGRTMLHSAVLAGDVDAVRFLVENGAGNVRDRDGKVPLWYALQHRDGDVRGRLEAELGAHAAEILVEVEDAVQVYLTDGVATTTTGTGTTGVAVERSSGDATTAPLSYPHDMAKDTNTSTGDRQPGQDDLDGDTGALRHTDGRKVAWLQKNEDNNNNNRGRNSSGGQDLLCWLRGLPNVEPPLGYTDEHVRHMEAGLRVVCKRLLEDIRRRREAAGTRGGHVEVEDWMAARDPFELLLSGFLFTSDCVEYVLDSGGDVVCDEDGIPKIAKGPDGKLRYIKLTERSVLNNHGSAAGSQSLALYMTMNTAMRAVGWLPAVKEWKGTTAPNVFELSPAPPQLHVIATFAPLIRGLDRLIGSRRKQLRTVFRGINVNVSAKYALGTHIVWNCFTSTTLKRDVARSFMYGKGGTFFVVVAKEGAADVKFSSVYASEDELLYTANIEYRVQWKLSPTLLRMMGLCFDVIVMQEVCSGVGVGGVGETSAAEQVGALEEVMGHTVAFFKDYLAQYVEGRVGDDTRVDESETRPLMKEVRRWLRTRVRRRPTSAVCTQAAAGTETDTKMNIGKASPRKKKKKTKCADTTSNISTPELGENVVTRRKKSRSGVLCVIGEGGSGKTSASIAIMSDLATSARKKDRDAKPYFPVFVALPTVKQHLLEKGGLDRFVLESFALREADRAYLAETYEVVLVLDSLDEVGLTQEDVGAVVAEGGLLCRHPWVEAHCSVVVTVRGEYLKGVNTSPSGVCGAGVRAVYMQPFTEVDARTYIERANTAWEKEHENEKKKETSDNQQKYGERTVFVREEDVEGLVQLRNPFVLHMACHAQCSGKASEEVIYEAYLETWTKKEMASGGVAVADVPLEVVLRAGELVACRMLETNEWQGTVGVASQILYSQHGVREAVRDACFRCLPFRIEDFGEEQSAFTFRHKSLGEHLAARRLARDPAGTLGTLVQRSFSKDSQRVLGFFAALVCADSELYERACTELLAAVQATRGSVDAASSAVVPDEGAVTAGSNAAALLARARIPVSGEDLSGIRVSNCDLRGSLFVETALTGASFSNCWLEHTEFHTCDMGGTMLPDCSLGVALPTLHVTAYCVAITLDGAQMVTGGPDGIIRVWSMSSGEEVVVLRGNMVGYSNPVLGVAVTPDGTRLVSCSKDWTVPVWDVRTGEVVVTFECHEGAVTEVAVTPDSSKVVSSSPADGVRVWDLSTGMEALSILLPDIRSMVVTLDGSNIVACSKEQLCVWDLVTGKQERQWPCCAVSAHQLAVTPDGCNVVWCSGKEAHLWNLSTGAEVMVFHAHTELVCVAVTPNGGHVVAGSRSGTVHVWSISAGKEVMALQGHTRPVSAVAVTPDGCHVVSCSPDSTVRVWKITTGKETPGFEAHSASVRSVGAAPDGSIVSLSEKRMHMWNASTGRQTQLFELDAENRIAVTVFPGGSHVVDCSSDDAGESSVDVWDVARGGLRGGGVRTTPCRASSEFAATLKESSILTGVPSIHMPGAYLWLTCCSRNHTVSVWNMRGEKWAEFAGHTGVVNAVAVVGERAVSCSDDKTVRMWEVHTGEETMVFRFNYCVRGVAVALTTDMSRVASLLLQDDDMVRVWDVSSEKEVFTWQHPGSVTGVVVTPDKAYVLAGGVHVWSMATGEQVAAIQAPCRLCSIAVSRDGREVMCGCSDKTVRVWRICTGQSAKINWLRPKRVLGVSPTVPRAFGCPNADAVEPELARRLLLDSKE